MGPRIFNYNTTHKFRVKTKILIYRLLTHKDIYMKAFGFQLVLKQFIYVNICKVKLLQLLSVNVLPPLKSSSSVFNNIRREVKNIRAELISL